MGSIFLLAIRLGFFGITWKEFKTEWKKFHSKMCGNQLLNGKI
jgi:hypothetical protein